MLILFDFWWFDRTPGAAPSGYFRYERTPQTPASAGSTGNRPYRRSWSAGSGAGGGGGRLSFGGSAEKKVQDIMRVSWEDSWMVVVVVVVLDYGMPAWLAPPSLLMPHFLVGINCGWEGDNMGWSDL